MSDEVGREHDGREGREAVKALLADAAMSRPRANEVKVRTGVGDSCISPDSERV